MLLEIPKGLTDESELAVTMIIAHESKRGEYIHQIKGPALGLIQMEPFTHDDTWKHADSIWHNAMNIGIITPQQKASGIHPPADRLIYDLKYNVFMARQRLFMKPGALPSDLVSMSMYLKKHWNSTLGKASGRSYLTDYEKWS
jgi:hypothetical protein